MTKRNVNCFTSKFFEACSNDELRESLQYIHFKDNKIMATNAHILAISLTELHFLVDEGVLQSLNGKSISLSSAKMIYSRNRSLKFNEDKTQLTDGDISYQLRADIKSPQWENIIEGKIKVPLYNQISISLILFKKLENIFSWNDMPKQVTIYHLVKPMSNDLGHNLLVIPAHENQDNPQQFAIFMQLMFDSDKDKLRDSEQMNISKDLTPFYKRS